MVGRVPSEPGCEPSASAACGVLAESHPSRGDCEPTLRRVGKGYLFIRDDGAGYLLDWWWVEGAKIAFASATVKAFVAWHLNGLVGLGRVNGWRWKLLPSVGDWAYRDDGGRLSNLAHFINSDLYRREREQGK